MWSELIGNRRQSHHARLQLHFPKHSNYHNSVFLDWSQEQTTRNFRNMPRVIPITFIPQYPVGLSETNNHRMVLLRPLGQAITNTLPSAGSTNKPRKNISNHQKHFTTKTLYIHNKNRGVSQTSTSNRFCENIRALILHPYLGT